jgi:hypothetical protein
MDATKRTTLVAKHAVNVALCSGGGCYYFKLWVGTLGAPALEATALYMCVGGGCYCAARRWTLLCAPDGGKHDPFTPDGL